MDRRAGASAIFRAPNRRRGVIRGRPLLVIVAGGLRMLRLSRYRRGMPAIRRSLFLGRGARLDSTLPPL